MKLPERDTPLPSTEAFYGGLPIGWTERRLRFLCQIIPSNVDKHSRDDELPVELCNYTDVYYNDRITLGIQFMEATATPEQIARFGLQAGDTVITKDSETADDIGIPAFVPKALPGVVCGYHLTILRPGSDVEGRFIHWLFQAAPMRSRLETIATGLTRVGLSQQALKDLVVPLPSLDEQRRIAAFLDHETARIDELVREQEQLNELLDEKHQATIKHVVENGLPGTVGSWKRAPFKYVARIRNGRDYKDVEEADGPYPVIGSGGEFARASKYLHDGESVLLGRKGTIDKPLYVKGRFWTVDTMFYTEVVPGNAPKFVYYVSTAFPFDALSTRTALPSMTQEALGAVRVRLPSLAEQHRIVEFLDAEAERVNQIRALQTKNIALLRERRSALISAAVTGQLDLRDWQPPESVGVAEVA